MNFKTRPPPIIATKGELKNIVINQKQQENE